MASAPNPFTAENFTLQDAFSALYYRSIPPSLIAARAQELGYLLFGEKGMEHFEAAQNGHFSYQDPDPMVLCILFCVCQTTRQR